MFDALFLELDFSEKLKVPLKYEPQSMHWTGVEVIVHSGILKDHGEKKYHAYLSYDLIQDHVFVNITLDEMLQSVDHRESVIIINSDNCSAQYKCAAHFEKMQQIANKYNMKVIRCYVITGHGKGEVDHVGGLTKVTIRREVGAGRKMIRSHEMVSFLAIKFERKSNPIYIYI